MPSPALPRRAVLRARIARLSVLSVAVGTLLGGFVVVASTTPAAAAGGNLYASPYGSDTGNNCKTQSTPCLTLAHAYAESNNGDTINLAAGTFDGKGLTIAKNITIAGSNSGGSLDATTTTITVGGGPYGYVLETDDSAVIISNVVVNGANDTAGGIFNDDDLTLNNVSVTDNISHFYNGAGIENEGDLVMNGGSITNNTINSTAPESAGAGLNTLTSATLKNVTLTHNVNNDEGGAIALESGTLKLTGSTAVHNNSAYLGGGIERCSGTTLIIASSVSISDNTPNDINTTDPLGAC
jgi:hypothetical protein